jgi:hypothetical protein
VPNEQLTKLQHKRNHKQNQPPQTTTTRTIKQLTVFECDFISAVDAHIFAFSDCSSYVPKHGQQNVSKCSGSSVPFFRCTIVAEGGAFLPILAST